MMAIPENGCCFLTRHFDRIRRNRRAQDVVEPGNPLEFLLGRGVREYDGIVLVLPGKRLPLRIKRSHDLTGKVCDPDHLANRIFDTKELITHGTSQHANVCRSIHVVLRKYCALLHKPALYLEVFRRNPTVRCVPILVAIDYLDRIIHIRRNALDKRNLILDGHCIGNCQRLGVMCPRPNAIDCAASSLNPDKIIPKIVQLLLDSGLSRFSDSDDTNDRRDSDSYSQDRQDAAHLSSGFMERKHKSISRRIESRALAADLPGQCWRIASRRYR